MKQTNMYANTNFPIQPPLLIKQNFSKDFRFSFACFMKNRNHVREKYVRSFINIRTEIDERKKSHKGSEGVFKNCKQKFIIFSFYGKRMSGASEEEDKYQCETCQQFLVHLQIKQ